MAASLVVSIDFELMWGVRDHHGVADYGDAVLGARAAIPAMLQRFSQAGIRATWATVGLLFARDRDEMLAHAPRLRPAYSDERLSPYAAIETEIGPDESTDPLHFGRSLVQRIADTEGQELATHTYSHFYCLEPGATVESFDADLKAARSIASESGIDLSSIVFPRNQMQPQHLRCCRENGLKVFRGNPGGFAYRSRPGAENTLAVRGVRLMDGVLPITGAHSFARPGTQEGVADVPASRFLRPWSARAPLYSKLHIAHVQREMRAAAETGANYHLWWHPHNMGLNTARNLAQLDQVIATYQRLRDTHGMESRNMRDFLAQS